tara:strand:+ start:2021 stop:2191 length:171 start_codon:yes stop_codon:yes gene_type:complete
MKNVYVKQIYEDGDYKNIMQYNLIKEIDTKIKPKDVFENYIESKKKVKKIKKVKKK